MRDWCSECKFENFGGSQEPCYNCITAYNKKPSEFTPATDGVRGVGKWINKTMSVPNGHGQTYNRWGCSVCKAKVKLRTNYCPNCGAKMEVSEDV